LGCDIAIHFFDPQNKLAAVQIGLESMQFQVTIPGGTWFAAKPVRTDSFCLVSCVVGPAFTFTEFEMAQQQLLLDRYGTSEKHIEAIRALTRA
jgi:predicted cupin superfamily sugar epimerase